MKGYPDMQSFKEKYSVYERKNRYHRRGMLFQLSIRITACSLGYILTKISSVQLNGKLLVNFKQIGELETTKHCYSTNSFKHYSVRQTTLPFSSEGGREQNSSLASFIKLCTLSIDAVDAIGTLHYCLLITYIILYICIIVALRSMSTDCIH